MAETFLGGRVKLMRGDCLALLPELPADSIDSCVTDPPYHLTSIVKRFGGPGNIPGNENSPSHGKDQFGRLSKGFMGKQWDGGDIAFRPETWAEVLRVLKPGAHLIAFSGTRTYHRMACAIEDAGFEIRDQIGWCYGSGLPKSHDVSKGIDRLAGAERTNGAREWSGGGRAGGISHGGDQSGTLQRTIYDEPATESAIQWQGWGTALKPAWEPIVLARKPLSESSIAANVLKHGTGGINVDGCRVNPGELVPGGGKSFGSTEGCNPDWQRAAAFNYQTKPSHNLGRWPANLIHDGSEEVLAGFPESGNNWRADKGILNSGRHAGQADLGPNRVGPNGPGGHDDGGGSAARFFYTAKADVDDRLGSKHPTVKPIDLMQYLVRLVTPKGGTVLDPFSGTGSLGEAAFYEGMRAVLIEREPEYQADIVKRMGLCLSGPDVRRASSVKQSPPDDLPLFAEGGA